MLTYVIVVNDNGELKTLTQSDIRAGLTGPEEGIAADSNIEGIIDEVLDRRSAKEEQLSDAELYDIELGAELDEIQLARTGDD